MYTALREPYEQPSTLETMITRDSAARRFVEQLDKNELSSLSGEIFAKFTGTNVIPSGSKKIPIDNSLGRWIWRIIKKRFEYRTGQA